MKRLWNVTNRLFHKDTVVGAFLAINIISWTVGALLLGLLFCAITGTAVELCITNLMCAAIYVGVIVGLFGGIFFLMRRES